MKAGGRDVCGAQAGLRFSSKALRAIPADVLNWAALRPDW
jgi:hypothetical protein